MIINSYGHYEENKVQQKPNLIWKSDKTSLKKMNIKDEMRMMEI